MILELPTKIADSSIFIEYPAGTKIHKIRLIVLQIHNDEYDPKKECFLTNNSLNDLEDSIFNNSIEMLDSKFVEKIQNQISFPISILGKIPEGFYKIIIKAENQIMESKEIFYRNGKFHVKNEINIVERIYDLYDSTFKTVNNEYVNDEYINNDYLNNEYVNNKMIDSAENNSKNPISHLQNEISKEQYFKDTLKSFFQNNFNLEENAVSDLINIYENQPEMDDFLEFYSEESKTIKKLENRNLKYDSENLKCDSENLNCDSENLRCDSENDLENNNKIFKNLIDDYNQSFQYAQSRQCHFHNRSTFMRVLFCLFLFILLLISTYFKEFIKRRFLDCCKFDVDWDEVGNNYSYFMNENL